jgi:hypothetical protein
LEVGKLLKYTRIFTFFGVRAKWEVYVAVVGTARLVLTPDALVTGSEHEVVLLSTIRSVPLQFGQQTVVRGNTCLTTKIKV